MNFFRLKDSDSTNQKFNERALLVISLAFACFAISPIAEAVSPPPDGGYPGNNTAEGNNALLNLTTGIDNTANGFHALLSNTTGPNNTATGNGALASNTTGPNNTANGDLALFANTSGFWNTAIGTASLRSNTIGNANTASGFSALGANTTGIHNTADGAYALGGNGNNNTATGVEALAHNNGNSNTAVGAEALTRNTTGSGNIALGVSAGAAITAGSNNIDIGNFGLAGEADKIRIGIVGTQNATFIAGIHGVAVTGTAVVVNGSGQLGVAPSSARFKDEIKPMDKASEALLALKPVTFHYRKELDPKGIPQFGLVAEEVEKVNPALVSRDAEGKPYTVRYDQVNAMLLNEFLKEHRAVQEQQKEIDALKAELKQQKALIQKVSDKVELTRPGPQTVASNQ